MTTKNYTLLASAIVKSRDRAMRYYGFDIEDANDMLMGINYVVEELCKKLKRDDKKFDKHKFLNTIYKEDR